MKTNKNINWDKAREILERLGGKRAPIDRFAKECLKHRVFVLDVQEWANEQARIIILILNKEARKEGRWEEQFFNFVKVDEEGERKQYYEQFCEATPEELAYLTTVEYKKHRIQEGKFWEIYDRGCDKYGREYQNLLPFALPPRPVEEAPC